MEEVATFHQSLNSCMVSNPFCRLLGFLTVSQSPLLVILKGQASCSGTLLGIWTILPS